MKSPFDNFEAFKPMFCDVVGYKSSQKGEQFTTQLDKCAVFPVESEVPFADFNVASDEVKMQIMILKECLCPKHLPKVGDELTLADNSKFKITAVNLRNGYFDCIARKI